jgi:hypothetical protein
VPSYPNGSETCSGGTYSYTCNAGFADADGNISNGCEVNLMTDVHNCGSVGNDVSGPPNAIGSCTNGAALIVSCHAGWYDVDQLVTDGCESRLPGCESVLHHDGLGQTFYDCTALGAYSATLAQEAANAWAAGHGNVTVNVVTCTSGDLGVVAGDGSTWAVWIYQGTATGHVSSGPGTVSAATCPTAADRSWA